MNRESMENQFNAAVQNGNPGMILPNQNQTPENVVQPIPPGLGPILDKLREPIYTSRYLQYRERLLVKDGSELPSQSSYGVESSGEKIFPSQFSASGSSKNDDIVKSIQWYDARCSSITQ